MGAEIKGLTDHSKCSSDRKLYLNDARTITCTDQERFKAAQACLQQSLKKYPAMASALASVLQGKQAQSGKPNFNQAQQGRVIQSTLKCMNRANIPTDHLQPNDTLVLKPAKEARLQLLVKRATVSVVNSTQKRFRVRAIGAVGTFEIKNVR